MNTMGKTRIALISMGAVALVATTTCVNGFTTSSSSSVPRFAMSRQGIVVNSIQMTQASIITRKLELYSAVEPVSETNHNKDDTTTDATTTTLPTTSKRKSKYAAYWKNKKLKAKQAALARAAAKEVDHSSTTVVKIAKEMSGGTKKSMSTTKPKKKKPVPSKKEPVPVVMTTRTTGVNNKGAKKGSPRRTPLKDLVLGSRLSGKVTEICKLGAFVETTYDIAGGKKGCAFLHISQIRDERVKDVSDVLKVGQLIDNARVITIDHAKKEVSVSLRKQRKARKDLNHYNIGDALQGRVKSIASYGAFIDVGGKSNALLHISRISEHKVNDITDFITVGQKIDIHLIDVDHDKKTMACSMLTTQADEYLDRREQQKERRQNLVNKVARGQLQEDEVAEIQTQLTLFEEAIRDLNTAFSEAPNDGTELLGYYTANKDTATP